MPPGRSLASRGGGGLPVREIARRRERRARGEQVEPYGISLCDFGVVSAANAGLFCWVRRLIGSVALNCHRPVVVFDLGLTGEQKRALVERGVRLCGVPAHLMRPHAVFARRPWFLLASPFQRTLFLDADCLVLRPIPEVAEAARQGELFVCDDGGRDIASRTSRGVANLYGVCYDDLNGALAFEEGVIGLAPDRHARFLSQWLAGGMRYQDVRGDGEFHDRGPGNVAWYSLHGAPPLRPSEVFNCSRELKTDAAIVRFGVSRDDVPSKWHPIFERFELAFEESGKQINGDDSGRR